MIPLLVETRPDFALFRVVRPYAVLHIPLKSPINAQNYYLSFIYPLQYSFYK